MNREIKFRAWEKALKEVIPVYEIDFENQRINDNFAWRMFGEVELMQYTNLKDKNGVEIYEGDIVRIVLEGHIGTLVNHYCQKPPQLNELYIVKWHKSGYMLCPKGSENSDIPNLARKIDNYSMWNGAKALQVMGNIYENPELLK